MLLSKTVMDTFYNFYELHTALCYIIGFLIIFFVDGKLPDDSKYKLFSKIVKWFGALLLSDVKTDIEAINNRIDNNHEETKNIIEEMRHNIDIVNSNRKLDSQASMRDRITQMYHFYQNKGYILERDKENFEYLFTRYTLNDGNSYVQNDIAPYMHKLPAFLSHSDAEQYYNEHGTYDNGTGK